MYVTEGESGVDVTMSELDWPVAPGGGYGFRGPPFPQKLYAAVEDSGSPPPRGSPLIRWTDDGRAIAVDADDFERDVMRRHPGLVEIASFANFRRQMREYGFEWTYRDETRDYEFAHPAFRRDRPDMLADVLTRRKRRRRSAGTIDSYKLVPEGYQLRHLRFDFIHTYIYSFIHQNVHWQRT